MYRMSKFSPVSNAGSTMLFDPNESTHIFQCDLLTLPLVLVIRCLHYGWEFNVVDAQTNNLTCLERAEKRDESEGRVESVFGTSVM